MRWNFGHLPSRRSVLAAAIVSASALTASCAAAQPRPQMLVHRDPGCGCCHGWLTHMQRSGRFQASMRDEADMAALKRRLGVPADLASCHTAEVAGFVIEGHVPVEDVERLLRERPPGVVGLATPGMPLGSPGMEQSGMEQNAFDVFTFYADGRRAIFSHHPASA